MHFGRVNQLEGIDFSLPEDTIRTQKFLSLERSFETHLFVGCPIWASKSWVGSLYPKGTRDAKFLSLYAEQFNTVEVNSTFYQMLLPERIQHWAQQVPSYFRFCPKVFRGITEQLGALDLSHLVGQFCHSIEAFQDRLGLVFAQLPEYFGPQQENLLQRWLSIWPKSLPLAIEFRHPGWFLNHALLDKTINLLYRHSVATVITDTAGRRDVLHLSLTQPRVMIRFQGNLGHPTDEARLQAWAKKLLNWKSHHLENIFFIAHQPEDHYIPTTTKKVQMLLTPYASPPASQSTKFPEAEAMELPFKP